MKVYLTSYEDHSISSIAYESMEQLLRIVSSPDVKVIEIEVDESQARSLTAEELSILKENKMKDL